MRPAHLLLASAPLALSLGACGSGPAPQSGGSAAIDAMIETHLQGRRDYSQQLWALLVLELWFNRSGK